jgi:ketosteroid isomerase-like protein
MISVRTTRLAVASVALIGIASAAAAQDSQHQSVMEEAHQSYMYAVNNGNYDDLGRMFAEDALYLPLIGGVLRGPDEIREHFEEMQLSDMQVTSSAVLDLGENMVVDTGTFSITLPEAAGGTAIDGEYVVVAEVTDDGIVIYSLSGFPARSAGMMPN